ncbi:hypothetical protein, no similarity [Maudiozyma saulgeensis]|uniref:Uncharacterized protein n=1 Tax=Maudiozyma saulgeensis TaxID=1789683 RepID=A0A1X7R043_9SACH|nr:hypothetical protein, no similarity [Kazachstania saulgeensis]
MKLMKGEQNSKKKISLISNDSSSDISFCHMGNLLTYKDNVIKDQYKNSLEYLPNIDPMTSKSSSNSFLSTSSRRVSSSLFSLKKNVRTIKNKQSQLPISVEEIQDINYNNLINGNVRISQLPCISSIGEVSPLFKINLSRDSTSDNQDINHNNDERKLTRKEAKSETILDDEIEVPGLIPFKNSGLISSQKTEQYRVLPTNNNIIQTEIDLSTKHFSEPKPIYNNDLTKVVKFNDSGAYPIKQETNINKNWEIPRHMDSIQYKLPVPSTDLGSNELIQNNNLITDSPKNDIISNHTSISDTPIPNIDFTDEEYDDKTNYNDNNIERSSTEANEEYVVNKPKENKNYTYLNKLITNIDEILERNISTTDLQSRSISPLSIINCYTERNSSNDGSKEAKDSKKDVSQYEECRNNCQKLSKEKDILLERNFFLAQQLESISSKILENLHDNKYNFQNSKLIIETINLKKKVASMSKENIELKALLKSYEESQ